MCVWLLVLSRHLGSLRHPRPSRLLIVTKTLLIGGWVESPVISRGNHLLIERYHKNLPRAWFLLGLLGVPFVPWQFLPMGTQLTYFVQRRLRRADLGDTHPHAWPKYRSERVSGVSCNSRRMLQEVFVFRCTINAPDLIEDAARTNHFSMWERGQVHLRG